MGFIRNTLDGWVSSPYPDERQQTRSLRNAFYQPGNTPSSRSSASTKTPDSITTDEEDGFISRGERTKARNLTIASNATKRASQFDSASRNEHLDRNGNPNVGPTSKEDLKRKLDSVEAAYNEQLTINSQLKRDHQENLSAVNGNCKKLKQKYTALKQKHRGLVNSFDQLNLKYADDTEVLKTSNYSTKNRANREISRLGKVIIHFKEERQCLQAKLDYLKGLSAVDNNRKKLEQKYTALKQEHQGLINSFDQLRLEYVDDTETLKKFNYSMKNSADREIARLRKVINHRNEEKKCLQAKLDDLKALHIRSVNSVGTGLEPITDKTFEDKFRNLQDIVGDWSRKISKHTGEGHHTAATDLTSAHRFPARVNDINQLKPTKLIETAAWDFLEGTVLSHWLPGFREDDQERLNAMLRAVQLGDTTSTGERAEYWRAYTASLLFQNFDSKRIFEERAKDLSNMFMARVLVNATSMERYTMTLFEIIYSAIIVSTQMRCQRGIYEIDNSVQLGDPYDSSKMINQDFTDENEEHGDNARVRCIISNGWVRRDHRGSETRMQVCKARVFIEVAGEDIQGVPCN